MNLLAEVALDHLSLGVVVVVTLHHHFVDVSSTSSLSTWKEARVVEHLVAAGELAHHDIFKIAHCVVYLKIVINLLFQSAKKQII